MNAETIGIVTTNAVLLVGAVWRISALLSKLETKMQYVIEDHKKDTEALNARLNAHEARILNFERAPRRGT
jgi:hypothetical protein